MSIIDKILFSSSNNSTKADNKLLPSSEGIDVLSQKTTKQLTRAFFNTSSKANIKNFRFDVMNDKSKLDLKQPLSPQYQKSPTTHKQTIIDKTEKVNKMNNTQSTKRKAKAKMGYIQNIPELTTKRIESEMHFMKAFIENNVMIPKTVNHIYESGIKETIKGSNRHLPLISDIVEAQKEKIEKENRKNNPEWERYMMNLSNPAIGLENLRKRFPGCFRACVNKYHNSFRSNYKSKILESTMVSFRIKNSSNEQNRYDSKKKKKLTSAVKHKLKWKTIKWFKDTQKLIINKLLKPYFQQQLLNLSIKKRKEGNEGITFDEFSKALRTNGITKNQETMRKLYWIFDEDGDNTIEYNEILSGLEIFHESSPEEKVKTFFNLCDTDGSNTVSKDEFLALLKKTIVNSDDLHTLRRIVDKIFKSVDSNETGELTLEQLQIGFKTNKELFEIISKNTQELRAFDETVNKDIERDIMKFNPSQNASLRQRLFGMKYDYSPINDKKFITLINELVETKELLNAHKTNMSKRKSSSDDISDTERNDSEEERQYEEEKAKRKSMSEKNRRKSLLYIFNPK